MRPSPEEARARWTDACARAGWRGRCTPERVTVWDGLGRVTAAPVHARWPVPGTACAAMDGIALRAEAVTAQADADRAAGRWQVPASSFTWVDTGDPMPKDADTVIRRERVQIAADGSALVTGPVSPGRHVRAQGEDIRAGELLIPAGHRLRPADLAAAAAAGHATLDVGRRPVVAIIPTGDEIRPIGSALGRGEVTDSNSLMLALLASEHGGTAVVSGVQPDDPERIAAELERVARTADLVLVIAGSSAGRSDHTAGVLGRAGGLVVRGVAVRPGHPVLLGYASVPGAGPGPGARTVPVIGIPGYPMAAAVIFELFAVPALAALQGWQPAGRPFLRARLTCDWSSSPDVEDWVPVSLAADPAGADANCPALATPGRHGAGAIGRLARADAWWPIPIGQAKFSRGEQIGVRPIPGAPR